MKPTQHPELSCPAFAELVDAVLDRTAPSELLDHSHGQSCPSCRSLSLAARTILGGAQTPSVPNGLTQRIVTAALIDRKARQRRTSRLQMVAVVAMLLVGLVTFAVLRTGDSELQTNVATIESNPIATPLAEVAKLESKPLRLEESVSEASNALVAMTDDLTAPGLFSSRSFNVPATLPQWTPAETSNSLVNLPNAASTGIEPVTSSTRRALNLFIRDTGLSNDPKSKF